MIYNKPDLTALKIELRDAARKVIKADAANASDPAPAPELAATEGHPADYMPALDPSMIKVLTKRFELYRDGTTANPAPWHFEIFVGYDTSYRKREIGEEDLAFVVAPDPPSLIKEQDKGDTVKGESFNEFFQRVIDGGGTGRQKADADWTRRPKERRQTFAERMGTFGGAGSRNEGALRARGNN